MEKEIPDTLKYFSLFSYAPTLDEIYVFLKERASKGKLEAILQQMVKKKAVTVYSEPVSTKLHRVRYTLGEYSINQAQSSNLKSRISKEKMRKIQKYVQILAKFPQIKLIGLSGTVAMLNAEENDDVDLFIITAKNRLFTGRFIAIVFAQLLGLKRSRDSATKFFHSEKIYFASSRSHKHKDKVCLNLFFDESSLTVPEFKKTEYVAHEILQMKPLIAKGDAYKRFLEANRWVFRIFPNARFKIKDQRSKPQRKKKNFLGDIFEYLVKKFQLYLIRKHQTKEIITSTQLWFHPKDFGKELGEAFYQVRLREHQDKIC